jgi:hypothetical protein
MPDAYDFMRVEQHYATQTRGLDLSFRIETAIFFATHAFKWDDSTGMACYEKIPRGEHCGVIYGFVFTHPPVKETQYFIRDFDFFKTNRPERVVRQNCALPLFDDSERNIAICDLDFIIDLDADFDGETPLTPEFMFPPASEDAFYAKLLELNRRFPLELENVVQDRWAL